MIYATIRNRYTGQLKKVECRDRDELMVALVFPLEPNVEARMHKIVAIEAEPKVEAMIAAVDEGSLIRFAVAYHSEHSTDPDSYRYIEGVSYTEEDADGEMRWVDTRKEFDGILSA